MELYVQASGSSGNSYILSNDSEALILDCGVSYIETTRNLDYNVSKIVGCIVTHSHGDHAKYVSEYERTGIKVFKPYLGGTKSARLGNFKISAFELPHDGVDNCGFLIQHAETTLLYMTDFEYCRYVFARYRPDTLLVEANYSKELVDAEAYKREHVLRGHAELQTTLGIIKANSTNALKTVILCHLSHENALPEEFITQARACVSEGVTVDFAAAGKSWILNKGDVCPFL